MVSRVFPAGRLRRRPTQPGSTCPIKPFGSARNEASRFSIRHQLFGFLKQLEAHQQCRWMIDEQHTQLKAELGNEVHIIQFISHMECSTVVLDCSCCVLLALMEVAQCSK